jgi:hypothetical protein
VEHDLAAGDVIAKAPAAKGEPVLAFTLGDALKLPDGMATAAVVGIILENLARPILNLVELSMPPKKAPGEAIVVRRGSHEKRRRHAW